jgi:hypothetical protein
VKVHFLNADSCLPYLIVEHQDNWRMVFQDLCAFLRAEVVQAAWPSSVPMLYAAHVSGRAGCTLRAVGAAYVDDDYRVDLKVYLSHAKRQVDVSVDMSLQYFPADEVGLCDLEEFLLGRAPESQLLDDGDMDDAEPIEG